MFMKTGYLSDLSHDIDENRQFNWFHWVKTEGQSPWFEPQIEENRAAMELIGPGQIAAGALGRSRPETVA